MIILTKFNFFNQMNKSNFRLFVWSFLVMILGMTQTALADVDAAFTDIKADFRNGAFLTSGEEQVTAGLKMNSDGSYSRVAADDADANAVITAKYHSNDHGLSNFTATVTVNGPVKITFGTCAWGGDVSVKNSDSEVVASLNTNNGACYHNNIENNIISTYYKGGATTLVISGGNYVPYFAVEAADPADLKSEATVIFAAGEATGALVPAAIKGDVGAKITLPKNFTMYVEGKTLTAWSDGTSEYAPGAEYTVPETDITLQPVFTENTVSLADRTEPVTLNFDFQRMNGAPAVAYQNATGFWVTQATIGNATIDVKADFDTNNGGKFANGNWNDWAQLNNGTKFTIPNCKGARVSIEAYSAPTTTTIDGQTDYTAQGNIISYEVANASETIDIVIGDGSYYRYIKTVLPVVQSAGGKTYTDEAVTVEWPFAETSKLAEFTTTVDGVISVASSSYTPEDAAVATGARSADPNNGLQFITFTGKNVQLHWYVKPVAGLTFTPTQIKMYVQRFGTNTKDGVVVSAKVGEEGTVSTLGTFTARRANWTTDKELTQFGWSEVPATLVNEVVIDLTAAQQKALASGEGFHLYATTGLAGDKAGGFSDIRISGLVNGTSVDVEKYTLTTTPNIAEAGSVSAYPASDSYEAGTDVTLTASENFGYDFVNWTNAAGDVVSTEAKFKYTMDADAELTANFEKVNTYELNLVVDGTNDYMVKISPKPTLVDGKKMYEEGTAVQLTADQYDGLVTFINWSDSETNSSKIVSMTGNVDITAYYVENDIIAGWDFYKAGGNGRKADFAAQDNDADALNLVNTETGETSGWLDKSTLAAGGYESFTGAAVNWRSGASNGDVGYWHWQTKVNAEAFKDIKVQFQMLYNYNAYQTYNAEYSLDGTTWTKFGSVTMGGARAVGTFNETLPEAANNQRELYIRMIADKTSSVDGSASANDGNTLGMFFITGTPEIVNDGVAPALVSNIPTNDATGTSAAGKIVLTFDERVKVDNTVAADLNGQSLTPVVSGKTVTFSYKGLEYSKDYTFTLPAGSVSDLTDNYITEPITINFTTMVRPAVAKQLYDAVVGNVDELLGAISSAQARNDKNVRYRIFIKNGTYTIPLKDQTKSGAEIPGGSGARYVIPECITFINTQNVSFIGESRDGVIITNGIPADATFTGTYGVTSKYDGIGNSDVFQLSGSDYYFQDLTIESGMQDATGRDLAVHDMATRTIYKNMALRGFQDTWTSNNDKGLYYFEGGYLRGRTDYMCGKGDAFFNGVELRQIAGGYAAVPSKPKALGWVYKDCVINGETAVVKASTQEVATAEQADGNYTLGRPWGSGTPTALFIDTKMNVVPSAIGWNEMSNGWPARFAEFNSMTSTGSVIDLSGRKTTFGEGHENNPVLTAEEALYYGDLHNMFGDWDPTLATEQAPLVQNVVLDGNTLSWDDSQYALLYAIVKNDEVVAFTTENTFDISTVEESLGAKAASASADVAVDVWSVRAANEMGGLNEAVEATKADAIEDVKAKEIVGIRNGKLYNVAGQRVDASFKGIKIMNGKKYAE